MYWDILGSPCNHQQMFWRVFKNHPQLSMPACLMSLAQTKKMRNPNILQQFWPVQLPVMFQEDLCYCSWFTCGSSSTQAKTWLAVVWLSTDCICVRLFLNNTPQRIFNTGNHTLPYHAQEPHVTPCHAAMLHRPDFVGSRSHVKMQSIMESSDHDIGPSACLQFVDMFITFTRRTTTSWAKWPILYIYRIFKNMFCS